MQQELQDMLDESNVEVLLKSKLGKGAFGEVWSGINKNSKSKYAIKFERVNGKYSTLQKEAKIMLMLKDGEGFPKPKQLRNTEKFDLLLMDCLGPNLERLLKYCKGTFSLKTVLILGDQMIDRVEYFHTQNLIHRDLKPENFVVGSQESLKMLYLIDYGIAKLYRSQKGEHISFKEGKGLIGTARYTSINSHLGYEQSRRDDLEGFIYTLIYLLKGRLPWQDATGQNKKEKYENIKLMKMELSPEEICSGLPKEFVVLLKYIRSLHFTEKPNYRKIKKTLNKLFKDTGYKRDYQYDWVSVDNLEKKLPPDFYKLRTDSRYLITSMDESKDSYCMRSPIYSASGYNKRGKSMGNELYKSSISQMVKVPITKEKSLKRFYLEGYTGKTFQSNGTSKMVERTYWRNETEQTLLKNMELKERKTSNSLYLKSKIESAMDSEECDFNSDMGNENDSMIEHKIKLLAPLQKKLLKHLLSSN